MKYTEDAARNILGQYQNDRTTMTAKAAAKKAGVSLLTLKSWEKKYTSPTTTSTSSLTTKPTRTKTTGMKALTKTTETIEIPLTNSNTVVAIIGNRETITNCVKKLLN